MYAKKFCVRSLLTGYKVFPSGRVAAGYTKPSGKSYFETFEPFDPVVAKVRIDLPCFIGANDFDMWSRNSIQFLPFDNEKYVLILAGTRTPMNFWCTWSAYVYNVATSQLFTGIERDYCRMQLIEQVLSAEHILTVIYKPTNLPWVVRKYNILTWLYQDTQGEVLKQNTSEFRSLTSVFNHNDQLWELLWFDEKIGTVSCFKPHPGPLIRTVKIGECIQSTAEATLPDDSSGFPVLNGQSKMTAREGSIMLAAREIEDPVWSHEHNVRMNFWELTFTDRRWRWLGRFECSELSVNDFNLSESGLLTILLTKSFGFEMFWTNVGLADLKVLAQLAIANDSSYSSACG